MILTAAIDHSPGKRRISGALEAMEKVVVTIRGEKGDGVKGEGGGTMTTTGTIKRVNIVASGAGTVATVVVWALAVAKKAWSSPEARKISIEQKKAAVQPPTIATGTVPVALVVAHP